MADEFTYRIQGDDMQLIEVRLAPGQQMIGEAGAMMYMEDGVDFDVTFGSGGGSGGGGIMGAIRSAGSRVLTGESMFVTHYTNNTSSERVLAFSSEAPGKILPLTMRDHGGEITAQRDAFLCANPDTKLSIAFQRSLGRGFFGGEGFILQRIESQGHVFLSAGGMIIEKELRGDMLRVDSGCIVAFESQIDYDIQRAGNFKSMMFGGEGLFLATLRGHGKVWLQSMPVGRLADHILSKAPSSQ